MNTDGYDDRGIPVDVASKKARGTSNGWYHDNSKMRRHMLDMSASERVALPYPDKRVPTTTESAEMRGVKGTSGAGTINSKLGMTSPGQDREASASSFTQAYGEGYEK